MKEISDGISLCLGVRNIVKMCKHFRIVVKIWHHEDTDSTEMLESTDVPLSRCVHSDIAPHWRYVITIGLGIVAAW
jgi:hypothetical protein